jgi:hypothetical protein
VALSVIATSAGVAWSTDGGSGVIHACVHQDHGDREVHGYMYMVLPTQQCRRGWARVTWNVQGPKGDPGPQGPAGPAGTVSGDTSDISALQATVSSLQSQVQALQAQVQALQSAMQTAQALAQYVHVQTGAVNGLAGPHVIFEGANVHIRSGSGATNDNGVPTGLGNLVIGYNEPLVFPNPGYRGGAHNLVVGREHTYTSTGGVVGGYRNYVGAEAATVTGGTGNVVFGQYAVVGGGESNEVDGYAASITGGTANLADGPHATVSGGSQNTASGESSAVSGGRSHFALGPYNWAAGSLFENF